MRTRKMQDCTILFSLAGLFAIGLLSIPSVCAAASNNQQDLAAAVKEVEQAQVALANAKSPSESAAFYSDEIIDVAGSGWIYTKPELLQLGPNLRKIPNVSKVVKSEVVERKVVPVNRDLVIIETLSETYYEVPNPQEVARAAGTMTFDPDAIARAAAKPDITVTPGSMKSPNPYRARATTVWVRSNGHWKIAIMQSTRVRERIVPGRL